MRFKNLYLLMALLIAVGLAVTGCGSSSQNVAEVQNPVIPEDPLNEGNPVRGAVWNDCDNSFVLEAVNTLCDLFGAGNCVNQKSSCNSFARQIYTGSVLDDQGTKWNARGGSGQLMADAAICTLRELSPKVPSGGPVRSETPPLDIGIGDVVVKQEVGYLDFDRVNARFKGYRKLRVELPVLGAFDAITQNIDLRRVYYGTGQLFNYQPYAGDHQILYGYGLNLSTEEKNKSIEIKPPAFDVYTPIGIFQAEPTFKYGSNTVVADSPSVEDPFVKDHTYIILPDDNYDNTPAAIRLADLYGVIPGVENNAIPPPNLNDYKEKRSGWVSQIGLGTRGSGSDKPWSPPPGVFFSRPDYDPAGLKDFESYESRSNDENLPSVYAEASAVLQFPKDPKELLPDWVDDLPGPSLNAYIKVTPKVKAGAAGQFGISVSEGTDNKRKGEFGAYASSRVSALGIYSGVEANASFDVDAELRLYVYVDFGWPIGDITFIDINPHFNIPLAGGDPVASKVELATAYSTSGPNPDYPEKLDSLNTFKGAKYPEEFINLCYAKKTEVPPEEPPEPEAEKGNPEDLFEFMYCNICMATDAVINPITGEIKEPAHQNILMPGNPTPPAVWQCDAKPKSGCMDLCKLNKETGEFTVVKNPSEIADSLSPTDPKYSELYSFYKSCMIPCTGSVTTGLFDMSCGKGLDATPPGILPMVPGGGGAPAPVPVDTNIAASFTEPMDPESVNTGTFTVSDADGNNIAGDVTYNAATYTAIFTPLRSFNYNSTYTATITTGVRDAAGNYLAADYTWSFTTEAYMDTIPPTVTSTSPASNARNIDVNSAIRVTFSEAMDESTIHAGTFTVDNGVTGAVAYDGTTMTATFTPSVPLANGTIYTVTITTGAKDISGNPLADNYTWRFLTAAAPDITPPAVVSTNPSPDATAVPLNTTVSATFSEPIDTSTVTASTFVLSSGRAGSVAGTIFFADGGNTATLIPSGDLNYGDTYAVTLTTGIKDLAGNPLAGDFTWNFTTLSAPVPEERTAFVTSVQGTGNLSTWCNAGGKTGLEAGDAICQARATAAELSGTFVAWLSDDNNDAYCRIHNLTGKKSANCGQANLPAAAGPWLRMDGFPFSEAIGYLTAEGKVYAPVLYDELNRPLLPPAEYYLTGTKADGTWDSTFSSCYNWGSSGGAVYGAGGRTDGTTNGWTYAYIAPCASTSWRLLCLETGSGLALSGFATTGKKVFVTSVSGNSDLSTWSDVSGTGSRGIAAGDAICQARAAAGGLSNASAFKAWLSDASTVAKNRLTSNGRLVRPDGVKIADNKADLIDGALFTAISQTETYTYLSTTVWTGTKADGTRDAINSNCDGWTNATSSNDGAVGESGLSYWNWSKIGYSTCSINRSLYCLYCFED